MRFAVYPVRKEGKLLPRHVMWTGEVRGDLYVSEVYDAELSRHTRMAVLKGETGKNLLPALLDAVLVSAKPDWWTMTGWERLDDASGAGSKAWAQSWILVPTDAAGRPRCAPSAA